MWPVVVWRDPKRLGAFQRRGAPRRLGSTQRSGSIPEAGSNAMAGRNVKGQARRRGGGWLGGVVGAFRRLAVSCGPMREGLDLPGTRSSVIGARVRIS